MSTTQNLSLRTELPFNYPVFYRDAAGRAWPRDTENYVIRKPLTGTPRRPFNVLRLTLNLVVPPIEAAICANSDTGRLLPTAETGRFAIACRLERELKLQHTATLE